MFTVKKNKLQSNRKNDDILNNLLKTNLAKPIDPSKLNKALTSLQVNVV